LRFGAIQFQSELDLERTAMKCPACFNKLNSLQIGSLTVDVCQDGCGGIWFDAFELQRVDDPDEQLGNTLLEIKRDPQVIVDSTRKRECPRCENMKLRRHFFSGQRRVEVDECPNCAGYWLDYGELQQVRAEREQKAAQDGLRQLMVSPETIRYLYQMQSSRQNNG
jgi:Zn-finger nucleic acid-binding protein